MKTKELIEALRRADPNGELPVCIENEPVIGVECVPAYYDGTLQEVIYDEKGVAKSARLIRTGDKVRIQALGIEGVLLDFETPVDIDAFEITVIGGKPRWAETQIKSWKERAKSVISYY